MRSKGLSERNTLVVSAALIAGLGLGGLTFTSSAPVIAFAEGTTLADGTYEGAGKGIAGNVPVTVTVSGGAISEVAVGDNSETQGIGTKAIEELPAKIVEANGTEGVDAVAGATITSKAIFTAVDEALEEAQGSSDTAQSTTGKPADTKSSSSKADSSSSLDELKDGTYEGTGKGMGGNVPVEVTVKNGKITAVEIGDNSETQGIGTKAIEQLPAKIVETNGTEGVDAVAGATITSKAIFKAVEEALSYATDNNSDKIQTTTPEETEQNRGASSSTETPINDSSTGDFTTRHIMPTITATGMAKYDGVSFPLPDNYEERTEADGSMLLSTDPFLALSFLVIDGDGISDTLVPLMINLAIEQSSRSIISETTTLTTSSGDTVYYASYWPKNATTSLAMMIAACRTSSGDLFLIQAGVIDDTGVDSFINSIMLDISISESSSPFGKQNSGSTYNPSFGGQSSPSSASSFAKALGAGVYFIGEDISAGRYDVEAVSGNGTIASWDAGGSLGINEMMGVDDPDFYISEYNGLKLENGGELEISGNLKVRLSPR